MNQRRLERLPFTFAPCQIDAARRANGAQVITFTFPPGTDAEEWAVRIVETAQVFATLFSSFARHAAALRRQDRSDALHARWRARLQAVQMQYHRNRRTMKHRAAVRALLVDPQFSDLIHTYRWNSAEFSATVRACLGPVYASKGGKV